MFCPAVGFFGCPHDSAGRDRTCFVGFRVISLKSDVPAITYSQSGAWWIPIGAGLFWALSVRFQAITGDSWSCWTFKSFWPEHVHHQIHGSHLRLWFCMVSAGYCHTVLLRNDGCAVACGNDEFGQCAIPPLKVGVTYTQVSAGCYHTVLLRSDGTATACGGGRYEFGQCDIQHLDKAKDDGVSYTQVSAGGEHTVILKSDGSAVAFGGNDCRQCNIPFLAIGMSYTQVSAGMYHTVLLRSDGSAVACGHDRFGECTMPALDTEISYAQVSAGGSHTVLLRSDGTAVACGLNDDGQCNIPALDEGVWYTQVSAGEKHTVLLTSDGKAITCGPDSREVTKIPPLDEGISYTQVSAGGFHSVLLRSDGIAVACGTIDLDIPCLELGTYYVEDVFFSGDLALQLHFLDTDGATTLTCSNLAGEVVLQLNVCGRDLAWDTHKRIARELNVKLQSLRVVLPDGRLLAQICATHPVATVADLRTWRLWWKRFTSIYPLVN